MEIELLLFENVRRNSYVLRQEIIFNAGKLKSIMCLIIIDLIWVDFDFILLFFCERYRKYVKYLCSGRKHFIFECPKTIFMYNFYICTLFGLYT